MINENNTYQLTPKATVDALYQQHKETGTTDDYILDHLIAYLSHSTSHLAEVVAESLNVNQRHLSGAVQLLTGITLQRFVKEWRLWQAKEMLDLANLSLDEVAKRCGYNNTKNLSLEFEAKFGTTPYIYSHGTARLNGNYKMNENVAKRHELIEKAQDLKTSK